MNRRKFLSAAIFCPVAARAAICGRALAHPVKPQPVDVNKTGEPPRTIVLTVHRGPDGIVETFFKKK